MRTKIGLYLLVLTVGTTSYSANSARPHRSPPPKPGLASKQAQSTSAVSLQPSPQQIPREIMYGLLFREIARVNARADELAAQSKPNAFLRNRHRYYLELSEPLNSQLKEVALSCAGQLDDVDRRAGAIIQATKQKYRKAPPGKAALVPPPPKELYDLQEERKQIVLAAADQLATAFGPAQFAFFESLVRRYVGAHYRPASADR